MEKNKVFDFELAKQLHEQFAISDNSKNKTVLTLIGSFSFVLTAFGYACWEYGIIKDDLFIGISIVTNLVLVLLSYICMHFGYSMRRDQIIIYHIRKVFMFETYNAIFSDFYNPLGKKLYNYLNTFYAIFTVFFSLSIFGVNIMAIIISNRSCDIIIFVILIAVSILSIGIYYYRLYQKYKKIIEKNE